MSNVKSILIYVVKELSFWFFPPLVFLYFYLYHFHFPVNTAGLHLYAIGLLVLGIWIIKLALYRSVPAGVAHFLSSVIYALVVFILLPYYSLVALGLQSWGQVITTELVMSYGRQMPQLADIVGIHLGFAISLLCLLFFVFFGFCFWFLPNPPQHFVCSRAPRIQKLSNILLLSIFVLVIFRGRDFILMADVSIKEPFKLSLFSGKGIVVSEDMYRVGHNAQLDLLEKTESTRYMVDSSADKRNVILIVVDALSVDHLSAYGYFRNTTPHLNLLLAKKEIVKFTNAHSSCGASACGLASIANSRFPHKVPHEPITLSRVLKQYGYEVSMILGGDHTNFYNLREHYGQVDEYYDGSMASGFYMNDDNLVLSKLRSMPVWNGQPRLFQFHLMSAHGLGKRDPQFEIFKPARRYVGKTSGGRVQEFTNYYDNGVYQADSFINEILNVLKEKAYLKDSLVIITADHGEALGEHQKFSHANSVYEELLHIPLFFMNFPESDRLESFSNHFVSQVDIAPTVLRALKMPLPSTWEGVPLQQMGASGGKYRDFSYFQMGSDVGLFDHREPGKAFKYWFNSDISEEFLFEVNHDYHEEQNLIWSLPSGRREEIRRLARASKLQ